MKMDIYVYVWLKHSAVHQKFAQYCKLTVLQLKKKKKELQVAW